MSRTLPNDVARCDGKPDETWEFESQCFDCQRRTAPRDTLYWAMNPPKFVDGNCPKREVPCTK